LKAPWSRGEKSSVGSAMRSKRRLGNSRRRPLSTCTPDRNPQANDSDHRQPPAGGSNSVTLARVSLLPNPQCVQLGLKGGPVDYLRGSKFISHEVRHRSLRQRLGRCLFSRGPLDLTVSEFCFLAISPSQLFSLCRRDITPLDHTLTGQSSCSLNLILRRVWTISYPASME